MADDLGAVLEAPEVTSADVDVEQVNDTPTESAQDEQPVQQEQVEVKGDERVLPQWLRNLKTTDPAAFKDAKGMFFGHRSITDKLKDFDLDGTKAFLEEHGGRESLVSSITELRGKAEQYDGLLSKIENADLSVLKEIPEESLAKMAPAIAEQWAKTDPEGWESAMSGIFAATIQNSGIPLFLKEMELSLKYNEIDAVKASIEQLKNWAGSFAEKAAAPRQAPPSAKAAPKDDVKSEREQWESEKFTTSLRSEVDTFRDPLITKELEGFIKRRPNDTDAKQLAIDTVRNQVVDRMAKDKTFQSSLNALTSRRDKEGAMRLIKSREAAAIADIAPKVGRTIFGNPATEKPKVEDKPKPQPVRQNTAKAVDPRDAIMERIFSR